MDPFELLRQQVAMHSQKAKRVRKPKRTGIWYFVLMDRDGDLIGPIFARSEPAIRRVERKELRELLEYHGYEVQRFVSVEEQAAEYLSVQWASGEVDVY
jgi:hypothetical protein